MASLVALGIIVRLYRITQESVWWDEYTSVMHLDARSLWEFLVRNRTLDPATLPLYYSFEYLWWHYIHPSIPALRMLSVVISGVTIGLMYACGRSIAGRTAAVVAALCLALSPQHAFQGQAIRMYVLFDFLALASASTFLKVCNDGRPRWWAAHGLANLCVLWTHPFAVLLLGVEALCLLAFNLRRPRVVLTGALVYAAAAVPSAIYLVTIRFWSAEQSSEWLTVPGFLEFLGDVFADDVVRATYQLRVSDRAWFFLPAMSQPIGYLFDALFVIGVLGCVSGGVWLAIRLWRRVPALARSAVFCVAWLVIPPVSLYVASLLWRPCIFPRYTLHSSLGLYLLAGLVISQLPTRWGRGATAAAAILLAYQLSLLVPGAQRTDWRGAAEYIRAEGAPGDPVIVKNSLWRDVFLWNAGDMPQPVSFGKDAATLAHLSAFCADYIARANEAQSKARSVWVVISTKYFDKGPDTEFEAAAARHGLEWELREFGGVEHVLVYRVTCAPSRDAGPPALPEEVDYAFLRAYGELALVYAERGLADAALQALAYIDTFDEYRDLEEPLRSGASCSAAVQAIKTLHRGYEYLELARQTTDEGVPRFESRHFQQAVACFREACAINPGSATASMARASLVRAYGDLAIGAIGSGRPEWALALLENLEREEPLPEDYEDLMRALREGASALNAAAALKELFAGYELLGLVERTVPEGPERLNSALFQGAIGHFRSATRLNPSSAKAHLELGLSLTRAGERTEAAAATRQAVTLNGEYYLRFGRLADVLERGGDVATSLQAWDRCLEAIGLWGASEMESAAAAAEEARQMDPAYPLPYLLLAILDLQAGRPEAAMGRINDASVQDEEFARKIRPLFSAVLIEHNREKAEAEMIRLREMGIAVWPELMAHLDGTAATP